MVCAELLLPQHTMPPILVNAQLLYLLETTEIAPPFCKAVGTLVSPRSLLPQHRTAPSLVKAQV
jgi:hypothetical protein